MFAVIKTGGKQYKVSPKEVIEVERLAGSVGDSVVFDRVLAVGDAEKFETGSSAIAKVVEGKIVSQVKAPKIFIQKHLRRKNSRKKTGHRQQLTRVEITSIRDGEGGKNGA